MAVWIASTKGPRGFERVLSTFLVEHTYTFTYLSTYLPQTIAAETNTWKFQVNKQQKKSDVHVIVL